VISAQKLFSIFFVLLLLSLLFASCGSPAPNSFINSSTNELDYISWNNDNGQLSGNLIEVKANGAGVSNIPITSTLKDNHVTINAYSITYMTGSIDSNNQLQIATASASGNSQTTAWYTISREDYNVLVTAFNAHTKLANLIQNVNNDMGANAPADSSSSTADTQVQYDQNIIANNNGLIQDLKQPYGCLSATGLAQVSDNFQLSNDAQPTFATLDQDVQIVQQQWKSTKALSIPSVNIPMPWRITQKQINTLTDNVHSTKQLVANTITADQQQLNQLKTQYTNQVPQYNQVYQQQCQSSNS
jgi:hypothetical protein